MSRSKKDIRVINEVKRALDAALADGTISEDAYARLNTPGLKTRNKISGWDECGPLPPEPEPEPEAVVPELEPEPEPETVVPEPEPEPEPKVVPDTEYCDAVVLDACVPEVAQDISCAAAPEMVAETALATSAADQVGINGHDESPTEGVIKTRSTGVVEVDGKEEKKGFAFTTCFRCGRVEVTQYGDHSIPKEVKGKCEVDNGIVMIVCGLYREVDDGSNNDVVGLGSSFRDLKLSPELFKGSLVYRVAKAMLSQEVGFIEDEGGIAYRDVDAMVTSLRRDDRVMSVDLERFGRGERTELMCGFLSGGLIGSIGGRKAEKGEEGLDEWGFYGSKKKKTGVFRG
jgi:hypothetical protein